MTLKLQQGFGAIDRQENNKRLRKQYLRKIDVESVLNHYGADNMDQQGDEIVHSCLLDRVDRHHANGDQNPSALANVEEKLYLCRTYSDWSGGDIISFIMRMEQTDNFNDVVPLIASIIGESSEATNQNFLDELKSIIAPKKVEAEHIITYSDRVLHGWASYHPWLEKRGISFEAASRLQIGYDSVTRRIVFPHWMPDGRLVGWQKRAQDDPQWLMTLPEENGQVPKYKGNKGLPKHSSLYNHKRVLDRGITEVIVVESPMSVAKAETLMLDSSDRLAGVVATFGSKMPEEQIALLRDFDRVTVFMDGDPAGWGSAKKLTQSLYRHTRVDVVPAEPGKDLGDYDDRDEVIALLNKAEPSFLVLARWAREDKEKANGKGQEARGRKSVPRGRA